MCSSKSVSFTFALVGGMLLGGQVGAGQVCHPAADYSTCTPNACSSLADDQCVATILHLDVETGAISVLMCECMDPNYCHVEFGDATAFPVGNCPEGQTCEVFGLDTDGDGIDDLFTAYCVSSGVCCVDIDDGPVSYDTCMDSTAGGCYGYSGMFHGSGASCAHVEACCLTFAGSDLCVDINPICCVDSGGVPQGEGSTCSDIAGPDGCYQVCGGIAGIPCEDNTEFCRLPVGHCCCDFQGVCVPIPDYCPDNWDPVCGCDGVTYGNECEAGAAGVSIEHYGPCGYECAADSDCPAADQFCKFPIGTCGDATVPGVCTPRPQGCPEYYDPVCGCDGTTYGNECEADAAGVSVAHLGACEQPCTANSDCPADEFCNFPEGTCGAPGVVGVCRSRSQVCPAVYDPVCGCDGVTYGNECEAAAAGVSIDHRGRCGETCTADSDCPALDQFCKFPIGTCGNGNIPGVCTPRPDACTEHYDPVCGCDGVTYGNECEADAAGVSIAHHGPCGLECTVSSDCPADQFCRYPDGTCGMADVPGVCTPMADVCPAVHDPVCGCDGVTYCNECFAFAAGVSLRHRGPCERTCTPGSTDAPCSAGEFCKLPDGVCDSADVLGFCTPIPDGCPPEVYPVCGCDNVTYGNPCEADAAGVSIKHHGPCSTVARAFMVPQGDSPTRFAGGPTVIDLAPGESVTFDVYIDETPDGVGDYLIGLGSATGGTSGFVTYEINTTDIDDLRPDWVYAAAQEPCGGGSCLIDQGPPARFGGPGDSPAITESKYLGEITYSASFGAEGTFVINFNDPGDLDGTHVMDLNLEAMDIVTETTIINVTVAGPAAVPATSTWSQIVMMLLLLTAGTLAVRSQPRRRAA